MNGTNITHEQVHEGSSTTLKTAAAGGSVMEGIGGIAAVVLAIIGLAGLVRTDLAAIAVIVIGASLLFEGSALAASYRRLLLNFEGGSAEGSAEFGGAVTVEFLAGFTGIVLGILALLGIASWTLIGVSVIVFGATNLLNGGALMRMHSASASLLYAREQSRELVRDAVSAGAGGHVFIGLAAIVLGILALLNIDAQVLNLVALLALGVSILMAGSFFGATRMMESKHA